MTAGGFGILLIGYQTGQRGDERPQPSDVHSRKKGKVISGKAGKQYGSRHIADYLAGGDGKEKLVTG